jgi:phospholipid/cholesterol/gamma-HCH transport system substrate-binding protein
VSLATETKVGVFTLGGVAILVAGTFILGDVQFRDHFPVVISFANADGLPNKGPVKVAGVEVGQVYKIELDGPRAKVTARIQEGVAVHRDARARVSSTGIIGSKYMEMTLGSPSAPLLQKGDVIQGDTGLTLEQVMGKLGGFFETAPGQADPGENLKAVLANLRKVSESLAGSIGEQRREIRDIVFNLRDLSAHAKVVSAHLEEITTQNKEDVKVALAKIRSSSERLDSLLAGVQEGKGVLGKLVTDETMGNEIKEAVASVKNAAGDAQKVLGQITRVKVEWDYRQRRDFEDDRWRPDVGLRIIPKPGKFYFLQGNNLGPRQDRRADPTADIEKRNTVTAVLGKDFGPFTFYAGLIRSAGGVGGRWRPFAGSPVGRRVEVEAEGFNFSREETVRGLVLDDPVYNAGFRVALSTAPAVWIGAQVEDMAERKNVNANVNVSFRDDDIAYLLGLAGLARP